uniref:Uncharacterized protein n=1 Tax=Tetraselmis sp. GSL018 TaxID=582737 RepID=A0A061RGY0_9CHLO
MPPVGTSSDDDVAILLGRAKNVKIAPVIEEGGPKLTVQLGELSPALPTIFRTMDLCCRLLTPIVGRDENRCVARIRYDTGACKTTLPVVRERVFANYREAFGSTGPVRNEFRHELVVYGFRVNTAGS